MVDDDYLAAIEQAGFADVRWTRVPAADLFNLSDPLIQAVAADVGLETLNRVAGTVWSYKVEARRP